MVTGVACFLLFLLFSTASYCQVSKAWETEQVFLAPESVVFDAARNCLYVSNFNDEGGFLKKADTLRNECISKLDTDGHILELRWIDGLHNPTGITIFDDKLYIAEREGVVIVNVEQQKIERRIPVDEANFLNDIVVDSAGAIYLSDTFRPCIHRVVNGKSEVWYSDSLMNATNGLWIDRTHLYVGNRGAENLLAIALADKTTEVIANNLSDNIDGIKKLEDRFLLSWKSELYMWEQGRKKMLYALDDDKDFLADFEYIEALHMIIIPQLISNKVIALRLSDHGGS